MNKKGFTLIELVMVIVITGILSAVAVPKYFDLQDKAKLAAENGVVGGVRSGIYTYFTNNKVYPATLDAASNIDCATGNICFDTVLQQGGITSNWIKTSSLSYQGPAGNNYIYKPSDGSFLASSVPFTSIANLVVGWSIDEGQGNTIGGEGLLGTISGAQWVNDPERGTILSLDGVNDYISVPGDGLLKMPYEQITYGLWFKSGKDFTDGIAANGQTLISKNSNFYLNLGKSGDAFKPDAAMYLDGKYVSAAGAYASGKGYADLVINDNQWYYLVATYDGSTMKLYKDGQVILNKIGLTGTVGKAFTANSSMPVYLGAESGSKSFSNGDLDDVAIFDRALTDVEINSLYQGN